MSDFEDEPNGTADADDLWADDPAPATKPRRAAASSGPADDGWDDDWDDDDRGGGRRDLTLVYAIVAAAIVIVLAVVLTRPKDDTSGDNATKDTPTTQTTAKPEPQWQGPVGEAVDKVEARIGAEEGVFIWTDFNGWHVRNTLAEPVTVDVTADQVLQKDASGKTSGDPKTEVSVSVPPGDFATGVDLDLFFSNAATFKVSQGTATVPVPQIKLGGTGQADQNPISFTKA